MMQHTPGTPLVCPPEDQPRLPARTGSSSLPLQRSTLSVFASLSFKFEGTAISTAPRRIGLSSQTSGIGIALPCMGGGSSQAEDTSTPRLRIVPKRISDTSPRFGISYLSNQGFSAFLLWFERFEHHRPPSPGATTGASRAVGQAGGRACLSLFHDSTSFLGGRIR